jgi:hypothetical protein
MSEQYWKDLANRSTFWHKLASRMLLENAERYLQYSRNDISRGHLVGAELYQKMAQRNLAIWDSLHKV